MTGNLCPDQLNESGTEFSIAFPSEEGIYKVTEGRPRYRSYHSKNAEKGMTKANLTACRHYAIGGARTICMIDGPPEY